MIKRVMVRNGKDCPICGNPLMKGNEILSFELSKTAFDNIHYRCRRNCGWVGKVNGTSSSSIRCTNHLLEITMVNLDLSLKLRKAGVTAVKVTPAGLFTHKSIVECTKAVGHLMPQLLADGCTVRVNGVKIHSMKEWKDRTDVLGGTIWQ